MSQAGKSSTLVSDGTPKRRVVVDTSVARAAADPGKIQRGALVDSHSRRLHNVMEAVYSAGHSVVFSPALWEEWRQHGGHMARRWLRRMGNLGCLIMLKEEPEDRELDKAIESLPVEEQQAARKDIFLPAIALVEADRRILSEDNKARRKYVRLVPTYPPLGSLLWVEAGKEGVEDWVKVGMPVKPSWTLAADIP